MRNLLVTMLLLSPLALQAQDLTGRWSIDLRNPSEIAKNIECGSATFQLTQTTDRITGNHFYATPRCGRLNEGSDESVKGIVVDPGRAVLIVTSGRSGAIAYGVATLLPDGNLTWKLIDYVSLGEPQGDDLILNHGKLTREK